MIIFFYIVSGVLAGIIAGMGMGGGTVLIPVLTLLCRIEQHAAQGINMLSFVPTAVAAIIVHKRAGRVNFAECLPIIAAGGAAAGLAALGAMAIDGIVLRKMYGIFLAALCVFQFIGGEKRYKNNKKTRDKR